MANGPGARIDVHIQPDLFDDIQEIARRSNGDIIETFELANNRGIEVQLGFPTTLEAQEFRSRLGRRRGVDWLGLVVPAGFKASI